MQPYMMEEREREKNAQFLSEIIVTPSFLRKNICEISSAEKLKIIVNRKTEMHKGSANYRVTSSRVFSKTYCYKQVMTFDYRTVEVI